MASHANDYDTGGPNEPKVFVGEWAPRVGSPTPNMSAALGDAAWMAGMERNADLAIMEAYVLLFVNVKCDAMDDRLIDHNTAANYGSPAYYAQRMFSTHHGDNVLATSAVTSNVDGLSANFERTFLPYSILVLELN